MKKENEETSNVSKSESQFMINIAFVFAIAIALYFSFNSVNNPAANHSSSSPILLISISDWISDIDMTSSEAPAHIDQSLDDLASAIKLLSEKGYFIMDVEYLTAYPQGAVLTKEKFQLLND